MYGSLYQQVSQNNFQGMQQVQTPVTHGSWGKSIQEDYF